MPAIDAAMKGASVPMATELPLPFEALKREIDAGIGDLDRGDYEEFDSAEIDELAARIRAKGRKILAARSGREAAAAGGKMSSD
jgi:hypothetical protein